MSSSWRVCLTLLVAGLLVAIATLIGISTGEGSAVAAVEAGYVSPSTVSGLLSVPGVERLDGGEQESDQLIADRADPAAVWARRLSRTRYEHLGNSAAVRVISQAAPSLSTKSPSGFGQLPAGVRVSRYLDSHTARLDLPGGRHAIIESLTPGATRTSHGRYAALNLGLRESGQAFVADSPAVPVDIPRDLASGVRLDGNGVSLTPVGASGAPLSGHGRLDGGAVVYPNTGTAADTAAKPISTGVELYDTLRSVASPQRLTYSVGMPDGATLVADKSGTGTASVVAAGHTLAVIPTASAVDAAGTPVPVSTSVSGHAIELRVDHRSGDYRYPIVVDPTVIDTNVEGLSTNWRVENSSPYVDPLLVEMHGEGKGLVANISGHYVPPSSWGALLYPTQGESHIYEMSMESSASIPAEVEGKLIIAGAPSQAETGTWEGVVNLAKSYGKSVATVCVASCSSTGGAAGNIAAYWVNSVYETKNWGSMQVYAASVYIAQNNGPTIAIDTTKPYGKKGEQNVFYGGGGWVSQGKAIAEFDETDPGVGVREVQFTAGSAKWTAWGECASGLVQCSREQATDAEANGGGGIPEGEPTIEAKALDAMGSSATATAKIKVDRAAPHEITIGGLPEGNVINDATQGGIKIIGHATDGVTGTPSSGVASLKLAVDGRELGTANGSCSPGPCTATGEWTIDSEEFAVGEHTMTVTATDVAGNSASGETTFSVHHASPVAFGPGELNPVTGEFDLEETDASVSTTGAPLSVVRAYDSREPTAGGEGPFGAPWSLGTGGAQELVRSPNGSMTLTASSGAMTIFTYKAGKFEPPAADAGLTLSVNPEYTEYTLRDKGSSTVFKHVSGDSTAVYRALLASGVTGSNTTQYSYGPVGGKVELEEELGPIPAGVSCAPTLNPGCRALTFNYAGSTTATGEGSGEWGDYSGRMTRVYFTTGEEKEGKVVQVTKTVAQYAYDSKGRLRAVWDPRISPALKTTYGYDAEGHVTAVSPAGKESWAFTYGTTATDTRPGRLIKAMRPPASETLWGGTRLKSAAAPVLSGSPIVKIRMTVSNGSWSGGPVAYGFQWEDCNGSGAECKPIGGATNANYTPVTGDVGHTLVAQVTATSGGGSVTASSSPSAVVGAGTAPSVTQSVEEGALNAVSCVPGTTDCVVSDSKGNAYYSTNVSATSAASWTSWSGPGRSPSEALSCPTTSLCVIAAGEKGWVYYATSLGGAWTLAIQPANGVDALYCVSSSFCTAGQSNAGYFRYSTNPASTSWTLEQQGSVAMKGTFCLSTSFCAIADAAGKVHVATSTAQVESSTWTESTVDGTTALNGVACTSTSSCVAVDGAGNVLNLAVASGGEATATKQNIDGSNSLTAVTCSGSTCVTVDNQGNVFISRDSGKTWIEQYQIKDDLTSLSCASSTLCVAVDTTGHTIPFNPGTVVVSEGEARSPQPGTAVEYNVPVSGEGAPYSLSGGEAAKWAQTDVPVEATAVFPVDEPVGWPAPDYRRATIDYLDLQDRLVNVASPGGGIVTSEYNSHNDVVRNLSADNRAAALKEGAKSAEASQTLDAQSTYNSEGNELLSTLGPLHTVKLASGAVVKARGHTVYSYDEGAPETGGPYRLVTKVTEGAQITGEPEADVRTTQKSYAGQHNLGWTLREPTSTTVDPSGLDLVYSTVYEASTGKAFETRTPGAGALSEKIQSYSYQSSFGHPSEPEGIARDSEGNVYVVDKAKNCVEELSSGGTFIQKFGGSGSGEGGLKEPMGITIDGKGTIWVANAGGNQIVGFDKEGKFLTGIGVGLSFPAAVAYSPSNGRLYITDTEVSRIEWINPQVPGEYGIFGSEGSGNGQFIDPEGIAVDKAGNVWVADTYNSRIEEFSASGSYISQFGHVGSEEGGLHNPTGLAFDSEGDILVADRRNERIEAFSPAGVYRYQFGKSGEEERLLDPFAIALDSSDDVFIAERGRAVAEKWAPAGANGGAHGKQTVYYTAATNGQVAACGKRPEWAGMPCEKRPAAQPETSGLPNLPVTTITYNIWDEPVESVETVGSSTRTNTNVYDEAGRLTKDTVSSSVGTALPSVEYEYNPETGDATKSKTTVEGTTRTLESVYNKRGELTSYKDADGNTSSFYYDPYGRLESLNDGKGTQTYSYDTMTGLVTKLVDSAAGAFTGNYDVEGNLTSVGYPNGMSVNHTLDPTGSETAIEYVKTTHCSSGCVWYSQSESPSIHGQTLSQTSTLSSQTFTYDAASRLTKTQDTPAGEGCTTRIYAYDQETNIDSLTTRAPGTGGVCASEGGTASNHTYDTANRLTDAGIAYDSFGDITKLPAGDAGGHELASTFYADETLASQSQNGQTLGYYLDPEGRDRQIVSTGTVNSTVTYHYAGDGSGPAWTEDTSGKWTRNVYGPGGLVATQNGGESPVLQIQDLKGDVVGTASLSETATGLLSKGDQTEYGVPRTSSPPKYSWQGGSALRTELPSGVIAMGARSYVPQIGRFLQPDPIEGGSANAYAYTYGDPVNSSDPSGEFTVATPSWVSGFFDEQAEIATEAAIQRAAEEQAAREEAEEKAREALIEAAEAEEAAYAATEAYTGGKGKKGKKGKAGKAGKVNPSIAYYHDGNGSNAGPVGKTKHHGKHKKEIEPNKHCEPGEVQPEKGKYCEKGPEKGQRPDPPVLPPSVIEEGEKDVEGVVGDCFESGLCDI
ncbi:MAG TPA: SMP-30/gluconolactonase/LRE family protein [Solirubrobacteraceae bacterium]|nr:SMP-30/gluconolactonase/LRE family protein [Solirubrobacteraceae bacterium]